MAKLGKSFKGRPAGLVFEKKPAATVPATKTKKKKPKRPKNYAMRPTTATLARRTTKFEERKPAPPPSYLGLKGRARGPSLHDRPQSRNGVPGAFNPKVFNTQRLVRGTDTREWTRGEAAFARKTAWYADLAADTPTRPRSASLPSGPRSDAGVHNRRAPDGLWYTHVEPPLPNEDLDDERATGKPHFVPYVRPQTAKRRSLRRSTARGRHRAEGIGREDARNSTLVQQVPTIQRLADAARRLDELLQQRRRVLRRARGLQLGRIRRNLLRDELAVLVLGVVRVLARGVLERHYC